MPRPTKSSPNRTGFAKRLEQARVAAGYLHQTDGARALGMEDRVETYRTWERGGAEPGISDIQRVCAVYGVSADFLINAGTSNGADQRIKNAPGMKRS